MNLGTVMLKHTTRTIGVLEGNGVSYPLVLRYAYRIGCVTPCIRDGRKLIAISGRFNDDQQLSSLLTHLRKFVLMPGASIRLTI